MLEKKRTVQSLAEAVGKLTDALADERAAHAAQKTILESALENKDAHIRQQDARIAQLTGYLTDIGIDVGALDTGLWRDTAMKRLSIVIDGKPGHAAPHTEDCILAAAKAIAPQAVVQGAVH